MSLVMHMSFLFPYLEVVLACFQKSETQINKEAFQLEHKIFLSSLKAVEQRLEKSKKKFIYEDKAIINQQQIAFPFSFRSMDCGRRNDVC